MSEVTTILERIRSGEAHATHALLPVVYAELRKLATYRLNANPGNSLQATELVHEAYLKLLSCTDRDEWDSRGHFFAAAAEAMRRVVIDHIRHKSAHKRGGSARRIPMEESLLPSRECRQVISVHDALHDLELADPIAASLVKLRYFVGMQHQEASTALGLSRRQADRVWIVAKAWLYRELRHSDSK